jgi:hypothetical protein
MTTRTSRTKAAGTAEPRKSEGRPRSLAMGRALAGRSPVRATAGILDRARTATQ